MPAKILCNISGEALFEGSIGPDDDRVAGRMSAETGTILTALCFGHAGQTKPLTVALKRK
jgi:hypothetical protein